MKRKNISEVILKVLLAINFLTAIKIPILEDFIDNIILIYFIINLSSFVLIILLLKKINIKGFLKYIFLYYFIIFIPTILNKNGDMYTILYEFITVFCTVLIWNSISKERFKKYLSVIVFALELLTYVNFVCILLYPDGMYNVGLARKYYLFGHVNIAIRYLLPGSCFTLIRSFLNKKKMDLRSIIYLVVAFATLVFTWTATALVGFIIFLLILFINKKTKIIKGVLYPNFMYLITGILSYFIIGFNIQSHFSNVIENLLHKDLTFSGRTVIWQRTISYIKQHLLLGYGRISLENRYIMLSASSPHNQFLVFLFEGGIVLIAFFTFLMFKISSQIKRCDNKLISGVLISTIASYLVMWISEPFSYSAIVLTFFVIFLAYKSPILFGIEERK